MKLEDLQKEARNLIAGFVTEAKGATAADQTDLLRSLQELYLRVFRVVYDLPGLRSLDAERRNFPALDLGDDEKGIAFQVTADRSLNKVTGVLEDVIKHDLQGRFPRVRVYVITERQRSYLQEAIDRATQGKLRFDANKDVFDFQGLLGDIQKLEIEAVNEVVDILRRHRSQSVGEAHAGDIGAVERDFGQRYARALRRAPAADDQADPFSLLAEELISPGASAGTKSISSGLRRRILLRAARSSAFRGLVEPAERYLAAAMAFEGSDSLLPTQARLADARGDVDEAIRLLRDETDADSKSVLLSILQRHRGHEGAAAWFIESGLTVRDLTANGLLTLSDVYLSLDRFDELRALLDDLTEEQVAESPYLLHIRGVVKLKSVFPKADRQIDLRVLPLSVVGPRPILEGDELTSRLDGAITDLQRVAAAFRDLDLNALARFAENYAFWCALVHPYRQRIAMAQLNRDLAQLPIAVTRVELAFGFVDGFDSQPLETFLARRAELGGLSDDELRAAFVVRLHKNDAAGMAVLIAQHRTRYDAMLGEPLTALLEIQALAYAEDVSSAQLLLDARRNVLDANAVQRCEVAIAKAKGADPVTEHLRFYEKTGTTDALRALVAVLEQKRDHRALGRYAEELYAKTTDPDDLLMAAGAFANAGDEQNFVRIVEAHPWLCDRDTRVASHYGWRLYQGGRLREAAAVMESLRTRGREARDFNLEIALAIESGHWEWLGQALAGLLEDAEAQLGSALIRAAKIAQISGQGSARELMRAALRADSNDPSVLLGAYVLAIEQGIEADDPEPQQWFASALDLSGPDGPVRKFEIKDVLAKQVQWNEHSRRVNEAIMNGEVPLVVAAPAVRSTIVEAILGNFVTNVETVDPRKRAIIPVFSGRRVPVQLGALKRVALDITAVLVLAWVGLLPKVLASFQEIVLPAGLLLELFDGQRSLREFQKSRVVRARKLETAIAKRGLKVFRPQPAAAGDALAGQIGGTLAALLKAARDTGGIVVRPAPVMRIGTNGEGVADVSSFAAQMTDLHTLLASVRDLGGLDRATQVSAERFFKVQDEGWPGAVRPEKSQPLYLDDLAVSYLQSVHLLERVVGVFDDVYIHVGAEEEAASLIANAAHADEIVAILDQTRETLRRAGEQGTLIHGPHSPEQRNEDRVESTLNLLSDLCGAEAVIVDDRALNKEHFAEDAKGHRARTITTLDVIDELHARGTMSDEERHDARHRLRIAGAALVPVDVQEILMAAKRSSEYESPEFRGIRESVGLARAREVAQFPSEIPWLVGVLTATRSAIAEIFSHESDRDRAAVLADAIWDIEPRAADWLLRWGGEPPPDWVEAVVRATMAAHALPFQLDDAAAREAYHEWFERRVLSAIRTREPERYRAVIERLKDIVGASSDGANNG